MFRKSTSAILNYYFFFWIFDYLTQIYQILIAFIIIKLSIKIAIWFQYKHNKQKNKNQIQWDLTIWMSHNVNLTDYLASHFDFFYSIVIVHKCNIRSVLTFNWIFFNFTFFIFVISKITLCCVNRLYNDTISYQVIFPTEFKQWQCLS